MAPQVDGENATHNAENPIDTISTNASITTATTRTSLDTIQNADPASATSNIPTASSSDDDGLQAGAVAGVAIGCFFAGLLLGIGGVYFLRYFRKSRTRHPRSLRDIHIPKDPDYGSSGAMRSSENRFKLENFILQATPDKELISMIKRLDVIIEQHVENYYHDEPITISVSVLAQELTGHGISKGFSGFEPETVAEWCLHPATRRLALQHVISHVLFRSIDCNSRTPVSLLPEPAVGFLRSMRPVDKSREDFNVMSIVLTRWRTLSALLLHPNPSERTPLEVSESAVRHQAQDLAKELNAFLHHFVAPDEDSIQQQCHHMHAMIIEAAKLGYAFFSHTSDWGFIYKDVALKRAAVICVGLEKLSHRDGRRLSSPQLVMEPRLLTM
ncbi:hypothetical protein FVEN_g11858 [Fusarium venenatum]|uniref:Uncharacterized protein n=1 Tax=Fusarium venenatum TaxID=56646 RepID=A0A2L2TSB6_9HYPO|nr:uncharacterized protein FVRRES_08264 [Fusarium venenatum]KAG8349993.1 hypothetical protein FVEN_g11858 [Fusarium venenatum]KAH6965054.1 hypothetical protein EDB82DRAFT_561033 [Fusarium venenatum]CEI68187.1 unnamed protein product [Fusarium venenatum]